MPRAKRRRPASTPPCPIRRAIPPCGPIGDPCREGTPQAPLGAGAIHLRPRSPPRQVGRSRTRRVLDTFFEGSLEKAVAALLQGADANLSEEELQHWANSSSKLERRDADMSSLADARFVVRVVGPRARRARPLCSLAVVCRGCWRASAAWRHLVWCLSVASLLLLPALSLALPAWRVAWLPQWTAEPTQLAATGQTTGASHACQPITAEPAATISLPPSDAAPQARTTSDHRNRSDSARRDEP